MPSRLRRGGRSHGSRGATPGTEARSQIPFVESGCRRPVRWGGHSSLAWSATGAVGSRARIPASPGSRAPLKAPNEKQDRRSLTKRGVVNLMRKGWRRWRLAIRGHGSGHALCPCDERRTTVGADRGFGYVRGSPAVVMLPRSHWTSARDPRRERARACVGGRSEPKLRLGCGVRRSARNRKRSRS
jgi:hypothetical protein